MEFDIEMTIQPSNQLAGAERKSRVIEVTQVVLSRGSGSAQLPAGFASQPKALYQKQPPKHGQRSWVISASKSFFF